MRSGRSLWAKIRQQSDVIDLQELPNKYWGSHEHKFTEHSQS